MLSKYSNINSNKILLIALIIVINCLLGACGFNPLYGNQIGVDIAVEEQLALIKINQIEDRTGQLLRNNLLTRLNIEGEPKKPYYILDVKVRESRVNLGVKKTAVVTRGNLKISAKYTLAQININKPTAKPGVLTTSTVTIISSYDIPQAQYMALAALKNSRARALKEIADEIKTRLGVYFRLNPQ